MGKDRDELVELLGLRDQIEHQLEATDKKIAEKVGARLGSDNTLGSAVPGSDYYYMIQSAVSLEVAHRAVLRQIKMLYVRSTHPEAPYGMALPSI